MNFYTFKVKMLNDFLFVYVIAVSSLAQRISWKPGKKGSIKLNKNRFEYLYEEKKKHFSQVTFYWMLLLTQAVVVVVDDVI